MSDSLKILIDRLRGGLTQKLDGELDPSFLGPEEPELRFGSQVHVKGEAYTTDTHLVIHLHADTKVSMPCAVCNQMIEIVLKAEHFYHTEPLEEIKGAVFDYSDALREALLIELPRTVECNQGNCPEREIITPFLRSETRTETFPFADMDDLK